MGLCYLSSPATILNKRGHMVSRKIMVTACDCKSQNSLKTESFKEIKQCSEKKHLKSNFHVIFPLNDIILYCGSLIWYIVLYIPFHFDSVFLCDSGTYMQLLTCKSCRK